MYIVEMITQSGKLCENFATYEEARRRVEQIPAERLVGLPLIFEELPDGSQRLVREDGKPLQWHRLPEDAPAGPDEPIPFNEASPSLFEPGERPREITWLEPEDDAEREAPGDLLPNLEGE